MNKYERMYMLIEQHGRNLNKIFKTDIDNTTLFIGDTNMLVKIREFAIINGELPNGKPRIIGRIITSSISIKEARESASKKLFMKYGENAHFLQLKFLRSI